METRTGQESSDIDPTFKNRTSQYFPTPRSMGTDSIDIFSNAFRDSGSSNNPFPSTTSALDEEDVMDFTPEIWRHSSGTWGSTSDPLSKFIPTIGLAREYEHYFPTAPMDVTSSFGNNAWNSVHNDGLVQSSLKQENYSNFWGGVEKDPNHKRESVRCNATALPQYHSLCYYLIAISVF